MDARGLIERIRATGMKVGIEMGCVPVIYYIAMSAHAYKVREEALQLLESYEWRDCFWESEFVAQSVRKFGGDRSLRPKCLGIVALE